MSTPMYLSLMSNPVQQGLIVLPTPSSISIFWNFGSLLGACLVSQVITGFLLATHYVSDPAGAFESVLLISVDVHYGWWVRAIHANGASFLFLALYLHIGRGIYYGGYRNLPVWWSGLILLFIFMGTAFLGYVLPWGQMSFWGATVITNLISVIPYVGTSIIHWLWGGFSVGGSTLIRFFALHFIVPLAGLALVMGHLIALHQKGSSNNLGLSANLDKIPFHPYFSSKDLVGAVVAFSVLVIVVLLAPWVLGDSENFLSGNPLVTPVHIKPEWYFLFAYAILRCVPNKLGGVIAMGGSLVILFLMPLIKTQIFSSSQTPARKALFWGLISVFIGLTIVGGCAVESPYESLSQVFSVLYFSWYLIWFCLSSLSV